MYIIKFIARLCFLSYSLLQDLWYYEHTFFIFIIILPFLSFHFILSLRIKDVRKLWNYTQNNNHLIFNRYLMLLLFFYSCCSWSINWMDEKFTSCFFFVLFLLKRVINIVMPEQTTHILLKKKMKMIFFSILI